MSLELKNATNIGHVARLYPRITDAYIMGMYTILNRHAALKGGVIQMDMLKKRLSRITEDIVGKDIINNVLLQVVTQRPI